MKQRMIENNIMFKYEYIVDCNIAHGVWRKFNKFTYGFSKNGCVVSCYDLCYLMNILLELCFIYKITSLFLSSVGDEECSDERMSYVREILGKCEMWFKQLIYKYCFSFVFIVLYGKIFISF